MPFHNSVFEVMALPYVSIRTKSLTIAILERELGSGL
jgi:hypothetical protein